MGGHGDEEVVPRSCLGRGGKAGRGRSDRAQPYRDGPPGPHSTKTCTFPPRPLWGAVHRRRFGRTSHAFHAAAARRRFAIQTQMPARPVAKGTYIRAQRIPSTHTLGYSASLTAPTRSPQSEAAIALPPLTNTHDAVPL